MSTGYPTAVMANIYGKTLDNSKDVPVAPDPPIPSNIRELTGSDLVDTYLNLSADRQLEFMKVYPDKMVEIDNLGPAPGSVQPAKPE